MQVTRLNEAGIPIMIPKYVTWNTITDQLTGRLLQGKFYKHAKKPLLADRVKTLETVIAVHFTDAQTATAPAATATGGTTTGFPDKLFYLQGSGKPSLHHSIQGLGGRCEVPTSTTLR